MGVPKLILCAIKADADAAIEVFGKSEHVIWMIWTMIVARVGLVITKVLDLGAQ